MAEVFEATKGKTRDLPISPNLKSLLLETAEETAIDRVVVTSGGQCALGTCTKRTGSTRHDNGQAADLILQVGNKTLDFTKPSDLPTIVRFVTEAARRGATGIGAGIGYMGPNTLHIGFGQRSVWGAGGKSENAPQWIRDAALAGWGTAGLAATFGEKSADEFGLTASNTPIDLDSDDSEQEDDYAYDGAP